MKRLTLVLAMLVIAAGIAVGQTDVIEFLQRLQTFELDVGLKWRDRGSIDTPFSLYSVSLVPEIPIGVVTRAANTPADDVQEELSYEFGADIYVDHIYTGSGRALFHEVDDLMELAFAFLCSPDLLKWRPDSLSLTVGFSAGATVITTLEWDIRNKYC